MREPRDISRKHLYYSLAKSTLRIISYAMLPFSIVHGAIGLMASEVLGIIEEL